MDVLQILTTTGAVSALGVALASYLKTRPAMKTAEVQGEAALWAQIAELRKEAKQEREQCDDRIARLEDRHAAAISELRAEITAEVMVIRHDRNNVKQALNYILIRIKAIENPDLQALAAEAEAMLARGEETIALEKGAMKGRMI